MENKFDKKEELKLILANYRYSMINIDKEKEKTENNFVEDIIKLFYGK